MRAILTFVALVLMSGCASPGGFKLYAPATWFSHATADAVDKTSKKVDAQTDKAVKEAQKAVHETGLSLGSIQSPDRAVEVAKNSNDNAETLLNQSEGPLTAKEAAELKAKISGLLSNNQEIRAKAEVQQKSDNQRIAEVSGRLNELQVALGKANGDLRTAFERENGLANELRAEHAIRWITSGIAIIAILGWFYARFMLGGIPGALGGAIARIRSQNGPAADLLTSHLDSFLNRHEQNIVFKAYSKASAPEQTK